MNGMQVQFAVSRCQNAPKRNEEIISKKCVRVRVRFFSLSKVRSAFDINVWDDVSMAVVHVTYVRQAK